MGLIADLSTLRCCVIIEITLFSIRRRNHYRIKNIRYRNYAVSSWLWQIPPKILGDSFGAGLPGSFCPSSITVRASSIVIPSWTIMPFIASSAEEKEVNAEHQEIRSILAYKLSFVQFSSPANTYLTAISVRYKEDGGGSPWVHGRTSLLLCH